MFTSPHAVDAFFALAPETGGARCACLGPGTAKALAQTGREDALGIAARDGAEFAAAFVRRAEAPARVLLPGAARRLDEPRATLEAAGFAVTELAIYVTRAVTPDELPDTAPGDDAVVFFASPSAVHAFVAAWDARPACVAIGETTARAAAGAKFPVATAATPDLEAMVRAAGLDPIPAPADPRSGQ